MCIRKLWILAFGYRRLSWKGNSPGHNMPSKSNLDTSPRLTDELLHRNKCAVSHLRIFVGHQLHDSGLSIILFNQPKTKIILMSNVWNERKKSKYFFPLSVCLTYCPMSWTATARTSGSVDSFSSRNKILQIHNEPRERKEVAMDKGGLELFAIIVIQFWSILFPKFIGLMHRWPWEVAWGELRSIFIISSVWNLRGNTCNTPNTTYVRLWKLVFNSSRRYSISSSISSSCHLRA